MTFGRRQGNLIHLSPEPLDGQRALTTTERQGADPLRVFVDSTVPLDKREAARETVASMLAPALKDHPHLPQAVVLVGRDPRRGGWQVMVVALDPALSPMGADMSMDDHVMERVRDALARL